MKKISAAQLKKRGLELLDLADPEGIIITKHGKSVAVLVPITSDSAPMIGCLKGKLKITGDIMSTETS